MDIISLAVATAGLFGAGLLKGTTGLGYTTCALPFLVAGVGLETAMALVVAPAIASNVLLLLNIGHIRETVSRFRVLYMAMIPGIAIGVVLLGWIDAVGATRVLGVLTVTYAAISLVRPSFALVPARARPLQLPVGLANGVLTGLTGSQILPLVPYMMALRLETDRFVQAINVAVTLSSVVMALALGLAGIMTPKLAGLSVLAIVPALLGTHLGNRLRPAVPASHFRSIVLAVLGLMGVALAVR